VGGENALSPAGEDDKPIHRRGKKKKKIAKRERTGGKNKTTYTGPENV